MNKNIELRVKSNESYGYLWRVIKESFIAAGKKFFESDAPHPDQTSNGWELNYKWPHINRRIWFRLVQNGWKHPGLLFRPIGLMEDKDWRTFPRPYLVTKINGPTRHPATTFNGMNGDYEPEFGWVELIPANIEGRHSCLYPTGEFFLYTEISDNGAYLMVNTNEKHRDKVYYLVNAEH